MYSVKEDWVLANNAPTHVCTWGVDHLWISDKGQSSTSSETTNTSSNSRPVILFLSGNPGIIKFYYTFLQVIYKTLAIPIWILSHAGHEKIPKGVSGLSPAEQCDSNNVAAQVDHKCEFIKQYMPSDSDIYIIAHSFGAKLTIELLKKEVFRNRIKKCYLLFPTLERIGDTRNGHKIKFFIRYLFSIIMFFSFIFSLLPSSVKWWAIKIYFTLCGKWRIDPNCVTAVVDLINPTTLRNVFYLASNEMDVIRELDKELISDCTDKLRVYFGTSDDWAPLEYHYNLLQQVPNVDSNILDSKYEHCFILETAEELAVQISERIKDDMYNSKR